MPFQQVFELKDTGQIHGSRLVDQSVNLGVKGMPGTLDAELFPEILSMRANQVELDRLLLEDGTPSRPSLAWSTNSDSGIYLPETDGSIGLASNGVRTFSVGTGVARFGSNVGGEAMIRTDDGGGGPSKPAYSFIGNDDLGIYRSTADVLGIATGGAQRMVVGLSIVNFGGGATGNARIRVDGGESAATPAYHFNGDSGTGIFRVSAGKLGIALGATHSYSFGTNSLQGPDGSASSPAVTFRNDPDTGIFRVSAGKLGIALEATHSYSFGTNSLQGPDGSASSPAVTFRNDPDTGMFTPGGNILAWSTGGTSRMALGTGSLLLQGGASQLRFSDNAAVIRFEGAGGPYGIEVDEAGALETSLYYRTSPNAWSFENSSGAKRLEIDIDTSPYVWINGNEVWHAGNDGSGSGLNADMVDGSHASAFASSGHLHDSRYAERISNTSVSPNAVVTSAAEHIRLTTSREDRKLGVRDWEPDGSVYELQPIKFYHTEGSPGELKRVTPYKTIGLGAIQAGKVRRLYQAPNGEGVEWNAVTAAMLGEMKVLRDRIEALEAQVAELVN